jgi:hypothetical protein
MQQQHVLSHFDLLGCDGLVAVTSSTFEVPANRQFVDPSLSDSD